VRIWERNVERGWPTFAVSHPNFLDWRSQARAFESLAATNNAGFTWTSNGEAEVVLGLSVTATCLPTLKISPVVGRNFLSVTFDSRAHYRVGPENSHWSNK
jgi:hypothetical protein